MKVAVDLAGDEIFFSPRRPSSGLLLRQRKGLPFTVHGDESDGPENVREVLDLLSGEYAKLHAAVGWSMAKFGRQNFDTLDASLAPVSTKARLHRLIEAAYPDARGGASAQRAAEVPHLATEAPAVSARRTSHAQIGLAQAQIAEVHAQIAGIRVARRISTARCA